MKKRTNTFYPPIPKTIRVCDMCEKELTPENEILFDFTWSDGYDSYGEESEFCSVVCLQKYIQENKGYITQSPRNESISLFTSKETMIKILEEAR